MAYSSIKHILKHAKWAPSGDNTQPWFITVQSESAFSLDLTKFKKNVYNLIPMPGFITTGMFLENAKIAAQHEGQNLEWTAKSSTVQATLSAADKKPHALYPYIKTRSVNRYRYKLKKLRDPVKIDLEHHLDDDIQVFWFESFEERFRIAKLLALLTSIRLRLPETYEIHRDIIDWSDQNSPDKMPYSSLGTNPLSNALMKWALAKQSRNAALLKLPGSTLSFELELDLIPALMCSGHFIMAFDRTKTPKPDTSDYIRAGQNMQRFWLTVTHHKMALHPWYIPITFSRYIQDEIDFTTDQKLVQKTQKAHDLFVNTILKPRDIDLNHVFFTGRIGYPTKTNIKRSVRKDLDDLIVK